MFCFFKCLQLSVAMGRNRGLMAPPTARDKANQKGIQTIGEGDEPESPILVCFACMVNVKGI